MVNAGLRMVMLTGTRRAFASSAPFMPPNSSLVSSSPLPRLPGTSLHRQLFMVLRDEIARGVHAGGMLPKDEALCERFGVSRITVRRALGDLAALGLVERRHGIGTFVPADAASFTRSHPTLGLVDSLRNSVLDMDVQVLEVARVAAPPEVAALLQLTPDEPAVHALRLRSIAGTPVLFTDAWVSAALGKRVTKAALRKNALYEILLAQDVRFGRVVQEITAQLADPALARHLQTEVGAPLLKLVRLMHDHEARPIEYLTAFVSPERSRMLMDIPGEGVNTLGTGRFVHEVPRARVSTAAGRAKRR